MADGFAARRTGVTRARLLGGSALALVAALSGKAALALDECGPAAPGGTVTCTPAGNVFPNGIQYKVDDLTIVVESGVIIDTTGKANEPGGIVSGGDDDYGDLTVKAGIGGGVTITTDEAAAAGIDVRTDKGNVSVGFAGTITTTKNASSGILTFSKDGDISIAASGAIATADTGSHAIVARADDGGVSITWAGEITTKSDSSSGLFVQQDGTGKVSITSAGDITTAGKDGQAIFASAIGDIFIATTGDITTGAANADGIVAHAEKGAVIISSTGAIATKGADSTGIYAVSDKDNVVVTSTGDISTVGKASGGIYARSDDAGNVTINSKGDITTAGEESAALFAESDTGDVAVASRGDLSTSGKNSGGIQIQTDEGTGDVFSVGDISTKGEGGFGISVNVDTFDAFITQTGDITTLGAEADGIFASADGGGDVVINVAGDISVAGDKSQAIIAEAETGNVTIFSEGALSTAGKYGTAISATGLNIIIDQTGPIVTSGFKAAGIEAIGQQEVSVYARGGVATSGAASFGIGAYSKTKDVTVVSFGDIATEGAESTGIATLALAGKVTITSSGDISTLGKDSRGILAEAYDAVRVSSFGDITTSGETSTAILATSVTGAVEVFSNGSIATAGAESVGILASASLEAAIISSGRVVTTGADAQGLLALSATKSAYVNWTGSITTSGQYSDGVAVSGGENAHAIILGDVRTSGLEADGVDVFAEQNATVTVRNVFATGKDANGIDIESDTALASVEVRGTVLGGWNDAAGIVFDEANESKLAIRAGGSVGALSDLAISQDSDDLTITNAGRITGAFFFDSGDDALQNRAGGVVELRQFADTDGDQARDKEGVAFGNFYLDTDSFENKGTLSLGQADGATAWDTTGQILHPGGGNSDITQDGVEQGFLLGLETFTHSGVITLQDGVAGDLLVITDEADGKTKGANVFTSENGALALDAVLDDGSSKQSDVLILDKAVTGSGATRVFVDNAGGLGGQTSGDGILVINVRDKSDADAFTTGAPAVAGAYEYHLVFQNQAKTDQNWYLQSQFFDGSLEYPALASGALLTWYTDLGGLHDRLGERRAQTEDSQTAALATATDLADASVRRMDAEGDGGWLRISGGDLDFQQSGAADFELNTTRAEAGFDVGFDDLIGGEDWLVLGAFAGYGWSSLGFDSGSEVDFDIATVGGYATYFRGPYYLDALVKLDWLDGSFNSDNVSQDGDLSLPVFGASLETGYRFDLSPGLYLQPQARLSFAHAGGDTFRDDSGVPIALEDASSLRGRLAARAGVELPSESGAAIGDFYLEAAVNQEFLGDTEARVSGLALEQALPETTFEIGGGFDIALPQEGVSFTVDADYLLGDEAEGFSATGGLRITW
jgi:outer membrane autotransporter protein